MSVTEDSYEIKNYDCNGSTVDFDFDWPIFGEEDLVVKVYDSDGNETLLALTTDYTASKSGNDWKDGGKITTIETYPSGHTLSIERAVARKQPADYIEGGSFPAETHEAVIDRAIMIIQELQNLVDRSIKAPADDPDTIKMTLPTKDRRKNMYAYFDADGNVIAAGQSLLGSVTVTDFAKTLLDDADAEAVRATLFNAFMQTLLDDADAATVRATIDTLQNIFTTKGDLIIQGASAEERLAGGLLDTVLKGQGAGEKPIFEKPTLLDTGIEIGESTRDGSGVQIISGLAFRPSVVFFIANDEFFYC